MLTSLPARCLRPLLAAMVLVLAGATGAAADTLNVTTSSGFARLLFTFTPKSNVHASVDGGVLTLVFDRKSSITATTIAQNASAYANGPRVDGDGRTYRFALAQPVRIHASTSANQVAIDLVPQSFAGTPPDLPPPPPPPPKTVDVNGLPTIAVRAGGYQNFTRLVFDWPHDVKYSVMPGAGKIGIRFAELARVDVSSIARFAPPWVKNAIWRIDNRSTVVEFDVDSTSGFHDFKTGTKVVLDILAPKTDADAYRPPGMAKPTVTAMTGKPPAGISAEQAAAIAGTSQTLAAANAPPVPPPDPVTVTPMQTLDGVTLGYVPPSVSGQLTRSGAVLTFTGAADRGSAVFLRGLTVWVVLQGAPPLDVDKLKNALKDFPTALEAASADGVTVLRITLKTTAEVGAHADGANLKVAIGPSVSEHPISIGFSRNQDDATHSSLSTLLPGATHPVTVTDPVAGDQLILVPSAVGRAMLASHDYAEFGVLKSASGLVLLPYVDDLSVAMDHSRVTITHAGGLALTPPSIPIADSPSAVASAAGGATYVNFAKWGKFTGGSFLSTERHLRAAMARLSDERAGLPRLALARFYVANEFGAEALGIVNLMQSKDPTLLSDRQLQIIRAAANYMMGRYRDAHNDIAGAAFDGDPHALMWRGMIETKMEDWQAALTDLGRAEGVLKMYPAEWQARARIAKAEAALALGNMEIADSASLRIPGGLQPKTQVAANLVKARLLASEDRGHEAGALFDAVERSGDERAAVESIYYRTDAALKAGVLSDQTAIKVLEKLRFRWRGDELEMKTLRKLASLYFEKQKWRDGLRTLRIAVEAFPNNELARHAQDDMRAAFTSLFIGGKADKLKPVDSLAIFFDFIDLTPIGPDGDEMIRKMSDRLIAVDLLEPAENLLKYQINKRLDGVARAQVATRLAMVYLMDRKAEDALDLIRATQLSTLPDTVQHQRLLLEARAFAALKQWNNALDLIAVDEAPDTQRLRADIYWESGNWAVAGQKAEEMLGTRYSDAAPLSADERLAVMRAAVAYSLSNDEPSLERLRTNFGPKMQASPDAAAFAVLAQSIDTHGVDFRNKAAQIASVDTLRNFMTDFRKRYQSIPLPPAPTAATN